MENYAAVKARMFARQGSGDTVLCGVDDVWCAAIARQAVATGADVRPVSVTTLLADGISAPDGILRDRRSGEPAAEIDLRAMPAQRGRLVFRSGRLLMPCKAFRVSPTACSRWDGLGR
jgi:UDP-N-acetylmuramoylalanine--D-glutamate ligase